MSNYRAIFASLLRIREFTCLQEHRTTSTLRLFERVFVITLYIAGARIDTFLVFGNVHRSHIVYATVFWSLAKAIPTHAVLVGWKYHFEAEQARIRGTSREKTRRTATSCCFGGS